MLLQQHANLSKLPAWGKSGIPMSTFDDTAHQEPAGLPADITSTLAAIEKERVPERLLKLALELQDALARQRSNEQAARAAPPIERSEGA